MSLATPEASGLVFASLERSAARAPEAVALVEATRGVTRYGELVEDVWRFARALQARGVRRGDRVLIALDNSRAFVTAYFGTMASGAVAVPLTPGRRSDRLAPVIADCTPAACITDPATLAEPAARQAIGSIGARFLFGNVDVGLACEPFAAAVSAERPDPFDARLIDQDLAAIVYTSGSTGAPRGVMLRHRNIVANTESIVAYLGLTPADRVMCVLPFYYVYGLSLLHTHLSVGGSIAIENRFVYPNVVLDAMKAAQVTGFAGVPSTFVMLLQGADLASFECPTLRYVTQAGGNLPPARIREWVERGPQVPFYVMYGATEASARLTYLPPGRLQAKLGSIGIEIPNVEICVVREDGELAGVNEPGEIVARGANIAAGYWNAPAETAERFGPLGYRTGDLAYRDEDGYLFLVGRSQEFIKVGAQRIGPIEIERVISEYPGVADVAVVGVPHPLLGEAPIAIVRVSRGSPTPADVQAFCRQHLPPYKVPVEVLFRAELPKTAVGKIDRRSLRDELTARRIDSSQRSATGA